MRKKLLILTVLVTVLVLAACSSSNDTSDAESDGSEDKPVITFGVTPWTSTVPPTEVASIILQDMGYEVEQTSADAGNVFIGLSRGDIDVFMDAWLPAHEVYLNQYSENIESVAVSYDGANAGWVVPTYMEEFNSIEDILGNEELFKNEMYSIEEGASATGIINEMIADYGLDINQVNSSEGGMIAQAMRMMQQEEPVIFYGWRPHTMFNKFDLKFLEEDRGHFNSASVEVITNNELKENAPDAYEFLTNWTISIDDVEYMIQQIEDEGREPVEVAQEWVDNNQDLVEQMLGN
ncbi:glycine betaine ABC transporter substrate-binding protein [Oceanobacillus saliphilus]|uniref:glycine betaine ABC transporter substrate-binding protein n=1 Tax=Oceanobacillus saliphilus TaxID=2925834 RepID=UPI00201DABC7|nr:glycine betaine ABC transporter substrate-binding protein [Oceanobacillus saliphilus]